MKFFKILGIVLLIIGSALCTFTDVDVANFVGIAVTFLGAAISVVAVWNKSEKKDWKVILSIILIAVGAFLLGFVGFTESIITQIITGVAGIVALIVGLIVSFQKKA